MKKDFNLESNFHCYSCDNAFTVLADEVPTLCPFCGLDLDEENEDESENDDMYIEYADED